MVEDVARMSSLLQAVLDSSGDAVVEQDLVGVVVGWNRAAARLLGETEAAAVGRPFADFLAGAERDRWSEVLARVSHGEQVRMSSDDLRRADGSAVHGSATLSPIRDAAGRVVASCIVLHDESERMLAQESLAISDRRVRRSETLSGVGTFMLDSTDGSAQWSQGMFDLFDLSPAAFDGTVESHLSLVHPEDRPAVRAALEDALAGGSAELDHRAIAGERTLWVFLAVESVRSDRGRVTGATGVCQDISVRKAAEASVHTALTLELKANEELRRLDALKDEFLATVSHELRTPLTTIIGFSQLLLTSAGPGLLDYVEPIVRSGASMARMIEKLLDYSRLQAGRVTLEPERVRLAEAVDSYIAHDGAGAVDQDFLNEVPTRLELVTDRDALHRILGNLIGNARHYAGPGSTVRVGARVDPDGATVITVEDNGPGIPDEHQQQLFDRFYQVPGAGSRRGTGIGLAIVREYAAQQRGSVWFESSEGGGATFCVRLPQPGVTPA